QANNEELETVIKDEITSSYRLSEDEVKESFPKIQNKVKEWWEKSGNVDYLKKGDGFFEGDILRIGIRYNVKPPVHLFTGRDKELIDLHDKIQRSSERITVISQIATISGLGGIGKTELARRYIDQHGKDYDNNVIWINAEDKATLVESFGRLARDKLSIRTTNVDGKEKDMESIVEEVYRFFAKRKSLFIFDNAEIDNAEKSEELKQFLPIQASGISDNKPYVLITSR